MAAVTNTAELVRMLNEGQDELKRSIHDLTTLKRDANKRRDKKTSFKVHPTQIPTRKRARTQQLTADQVCALFDYDMHYNIVEQLISPRQSVNSSPLEQATPPRKRAPRRHSSTPKVKTSVQEPQCTPKSKPFKDISLEEAVFSNHAGSSSRRNKRILKDNKTHKSPKEQLTEALNASHYGALECTLPLTRSLRKSHKYEGIDPKLGYDWIAGILDTSSYIAKCSDDYFDEMKEFRRANREDCCRMTSLMSVELST